MFVYIFCFPGRIKAAQLEYSEAHKHLLQALRKAPQQTAVGFKQTVSQGCEIPCPTCPTCPICLRTSKTFTQFLAKECAKYWLTALIEDYACPVNMCLGKLSKLDMTPLSGGCKTSTQTNKIFTCPGIRTSLLQL